MARRRRTGLTVLIGILVVLALLWTGLWYGASLLATRALASIGGSEAEPAFRCTQQSIAGYPLRFDFSCQDAAFSDRASLANGSVAGISASAPLYNPGQVDIAATGPLRLETPGLGRLEVAWQQATTAFHVGFGGLDRAAITLGEVNLSIADPGPDVGLRLLTATSGSASVMPDRDLADSLAFSLAASQVAVETADGRALPPLTVDFAATVEGIGGSIGGEWEQRQAAWLAAGGRIHLTRLSIDAGHSTVAAGGDLSVGQDGLLSGKLTFTLTGLEGLPTVAEAFHPGAGKEVTKVLDMISGLTKPVDTATGPGKTLDLTLRNGAVMVGILPLPFVRLPPLFEAPGTS